MDTSAPGACDDEPVTEVGIARRLAAEHGHRLRHVLAWNRWLVWDGRRWALDEVGEVAGCAKATARRLLHQAADTEEGPARKALMRAGLRAESAAGVRAVVELAGTEPGVVLAPAALDADPWALNTATGVVDLRTGALTPHDPGLHLTKVTAAGYLPGAEAPEFEKFLTRVQPDPAVRAFLARLLGYAVLGVVTEHVLPVFYGVGANGKSTLAEAVVAALGDYAGTADPGLLVERGDVHPTGAAALHGMRLVVAHESDQGARLAEGTVKRLTGGDKITARRMREDFWSFTPSHLLIMLTNHRPIVRGDDEGIWRRLRLVPFEVQIPPAERDPELGLRLAEERDGILGWLLDGLAAYHSEGLDEPDTVTAATAAYRADEDVLGRFLSECCITVAGASVRSSALFAEWSRWTDTEGVRPGTQTAFSTALLARGFDKQKSGGHMVWRGLGLTLPSDETDQVSDQRRRRSGEGWGGSNH